MTPPLPTSGGTLEQRGGTLGATTTTGPTIVDSFEDQDVSEYAGDTGDFSTTTSAGVTDGTYALTTAATGNFELITSESGLPAYPGVGDTYRVDVRYTSGSNRPGVYWRVTAGDGFRLRFEPATDSIVVQDPANNTIASDSSAGIMADTRYTVEVDQVASDDWTVTVYEGGPSGTVIFSPSFTDTTDSTATGIGFGESAGSGNVFFDYARIV